MPESVIEFLLNNDLDCFIQYGGVKDANMVYATGFRPPDPVFYLIFIDTDVLLVPQMEYHRALKESRVREVYSYEDLGWRELYKKEKNMDKAMAKAITNFLQSYGATSLGIPGNFPSGYGFVFEEYFDVKIVSNPFAHMRAVKTEYEIASIVESSHVAVDAITMVVEYLSNHVRELKKGKLTSEKLRNMVEVELFNQGYVAENTIVSSGVSTGNPHEVGNGKIEWNSHIILDIFPRSKRTGYCSDVTRTIFLGEVSDQITEMFDVVREAYVTAEKMVKEGIGVREIYNAVCDVFEERGYDTLRKESKKGFIHSTGHGVGLEVHELPSVADNDYILKAGNVITIEPGLYYPEIGGVRLENLVVVKKNGCQVLTRYPQEVWIRHE
jgi:Xaa-Pro aminopeptidase